jgi:hypothetical protein
LASIGTITTGVWNGTTVATGYGGTGLTSFTSGGAVYATSTSALTTGTLPIASGGTGGTTQATAQTSLNVPSTTGTGASGTWPISITGSSASASTATTATNIAGGAANQIPYQSGSGTTTFVPVPTVPAYLQYTGSGFAWNNGAGMGSVSSVALTVPPFLSVSGSPITTTGTLAVTLSGTALPVANGGTGVTSFGGVNTLLYTSSANTLTSLPIGTNGQILVVNSGGNLAWSTTLPATAGVDSINFGTTGLTPNTDTQGAVTVSGTLNVANGGTGQTSALTQFGVVYAGTTSAMAVTSAGTAGQVLISNGTSAPTWQTLAVADNSLLWYFMG